MDENKIKQAAAEHLEKQFAGEAPSQIPIHVTRKSYERMMLHCKDENGRWYCPKSGANVKGRMTMRRVYNRGTFSLEHNEVPVMEMYCARCDENDKPKTAKGAAIMSDELITICL